MIFKIVQILYIIININIFNNKNVTFNQKLLMFIFYYLFYLLI